MCVQFDTHIAGAYAMGGGGACAVLFGVACALSLLQALPVLARFSSAPLGPEDQGGFRFPPLDPLDSCIPLETTRGKPLDPRGLILTKQKQLLQVPTKVPIFRARQVTRPRVH